MHIVYVHQTEIKSNEIQSIPMFLHQHTHTHVHVTSNMVSQLDKHPVWRLPSAIGEPVTTEQTILRQSKRSRSSPANMQTRLSLERVKARLQRAQASLSGVFKMPTHSASAAPAWMMADSRTQTGYPASYSSTLKLMEQTLTHICRAPPPFSGDSKYQ